MYVDSFVFIEEDGIDLSSQMEQFDQWFDSHSGEVKHVTHAVAVVGGQVQHYYTVFFEGAAEATEEEIDDYINQHLDNPDPDYR